MSSPKVVALYNVYNDAEFLERSLKSVVDLADMIVVADGAYKDYPYRGTPASDDGTKEIASSYADIFMSCGHEPWRSEGHKRNTLLGCVPQGWWALRIDADEEVEEFDKQYLSNCPRVVHTRFKNYNEDGSVDRKFWVNALFKPEPDWYYNKRDGLFKGSKSITSLQSMRSDRFVFGHHQYARPTERLERRAEYRENIGQHFIEPRED